MKKTSLLILSALFAVAAPVVRAQKIERALTYDKYTVADTFTYNKTVRHIQWDKIKEALRNVEQMQENEPHWGVFQNKNNVNGEASLVKEWHRDEYGRVADRNNLQRYQSVPLYSLTDSEGAPEIYGRDGSPVKILEEVDSTARFYIETVNLKGRWSVPTKYVKRLDLQTVFNHVIIVDLAMQIVVTLDKEGEAWKVRSINPATTGLHKPPYQQPTPLGIYVVQEKKPKMFYTKDGSSEIEGYAPWASRFSCGAYVHGVPTNSVNAQPIEYGWTLGSTPRSHMCVRNATSHAKFVYDWAPTLRSLVVVIE